MCGRYLFTSPLEAVQQMFKFDQMTNLWPNYSVAPTREMPIARRKRVDRGNELAIVRWASFRIRRRTRRSPTARSMHAPRRL